MNSETIKFKVEEDLTKPSHSLEKYRPEKILREIFRKKEDKKESNFYHRNGVKMEVLFYEFDTEQKEFYNKRKSSLLSGLLEAYRNHYPIVINPDTIWLMILQNFSNFLDKYHELVRHKFVNYENKKTIQVDKFDIIPEKAAKEEWRDIFKQFIEKIGEIIGNNAVKSFSPDFSTTSQVSLTTGQLSIMTGMKHYIEYVLSIIACGVSEIELEGSLEDWKKLLEKTKFLDNYAMGWWTKEIIPIIQKIIFTKEYFSENKCINEEIRKFWKTFIRIKKEGGYYEPTILDGWIVKFFPDIEKRKVLDEIEEHQIKNEILSCPLKLKVSYPDGKGILYDCSIESGFFGMAQDPYTYAVKPVLGYAIVVVNKEEFSLTIEEKEEIIKKYFS